MLWGRTDFTGSGRQDPRVESLLQTQALLWLRQDEAPETPVLDPEAELQEEQDQGRRLLCSVCRQAVTSQGQRREVAGKSSHVCANPHGFVFEIGCFAKAWGCKGLGPQSTEFSWFPGYAWQIVQCSQCGSHLGWRFTAVQAEGAGFYGLILDRLVEEQD
jgi:hypothetical protein